MNYYSAYQPGKDGLLCLCVCAHEVCVYVCLWICQFILPSSIQKDRQPVEAYAAEKK